MSDEAAFLAVIAAAPSDTAPRLVYADWLEDRGDPRAEWLRAECDYHKGVNHGKRSRRMWKLREKLDHDWVALVTRPPLADAITAALGEIGPLLGGINFAVDFGLYRVPLIAHAKLEQYMTAALGADAVVAQLTPCPGTALLAAYWRFLQRSGELADPDLLTPRARRFKQRVRCIQEYLEQSVAEADIVASFSLYSGYPFDGDIFFAYLIVKPRCAVVFVGASSY